VTVRINDRGPHRRGAVIDLSRRAAEQIGLVTEGVGVVSLRVVSPPPDR
jgi:rare lipoprotein A